MRNTIWSVISIADLGWCYSSLSFFDPDGMRFHLPAYLVAELEGRLTGYVLFHLVLTVDDAARYFCTLSRAPRAAVREFLLLRLSGPHDEFVHPMIETALHEYWTPPE